MSDAPKARKCAGPQTAPKMKYADGSMMGDGLKRCAACKSVRCRGFDNCQKAHDNTQMAVCKRRANEFKTAVAAWDDLMARRPECLICSLPLPLKDNLCTYMACCGKLLCNGCMCGHIDAQIEKGVVGSCAFCRQPVDCGDEENISRLQQQVEKKDAYAMSCLADKYNEGHGVGKDQRKAFKLYRRSAELGNIGAEFSLGWAYVEGSPVVKRDGKKARKHFEQAAARGHVPSRYILGAFCLSQHDYEAAYFNFRLAASAGLEEALEGVKRGYKEGFVTKDEFAKTLRAFQAAQGEMRSSGRDEAASIF